MSKPETLAEIAERVAYRYELYRLCGDPQKAYDEIVRRDQRIKRLEEISADLAGEVDRLWHLKSEAA